MALKYAYTYLLFQGRSAQICSLMTVLVFIFLKRTVCALAFRSDFTLKRQRSTDSPLPLMPLFGAKMGADFFVVRRKNNGIQRNVGIRKKKFGHS